MKRFRKLKAQKREVQLVKRMSAQVLNQVFQKENNLDEFGFIDKYIVGDKAQNILNHIDSQKPIIFKAHKVISF